ncbi:small subunit ribosomal protein S6 [Bacilli bacterium PM5-3]|nr:small subunit ribosomal protein S6 [Bacilli bacterium PM5-3]MDH6603375.1 small subunit ribosomal protein S6 [Bacilli bacterium PM5-9]
MRKYEIMYIIHPSLDEALSNEIVEKYNKVITEDGSKVLEVKDWGLRDLAYEIKKVNKGHYIILKVEASNEAIAEYERLSLIDSNIIRHIVIKEEE